MVTVDPAVLDAAGGATISASSTFTTAVQNALNALSASGGMTGTDPAGLVVGEKYDDAASAVVVALVDTGNGTSRIGDLLKMSAYNYAIANHYSSIKPGGGPPTKPTATKPVSSHVPPKGEGSLSDAPFGWGLIQSVIGMVWPNGDIGKMRSAASQWTAIANAANTFDAALVGPENQAKGQDIPEKGDVSSGFSDAAKAAAGMSKAAGDIAKQLNAYAQHVDDAHTHLKKLIGEALHLATPSGLFQEGLSLITGKGEQLKKIAHEALQVLQDLKTEADAVGQLFAPIVAAVEAFGKVMANWAEAELQDIGDDLYNVAADVVNAVASYGNAMIQHPEDLPGLVAGAFMMAQGGVLLGADGVFEVATAGLGTPIAIPVAAVGLAEVAVGGAIAAPSALDLAHAAAGESAVTVMHQQVRDSRGRYQGHDGPSADKEAAGIKSYGKTNPDRTVVPNQSQAKFPEGTGPVKPNGDPRVRKFDGYDMPKNPKPGPDGYVEAKGVEVKSGTAGLSGNQKGFDPHVSAETPAYGTAKLPDGSVVPVKITEVVEVRVP
ncbi:hypothetical protein [Mycobacteroides chelonae]|uniref:hypothetical protein n=1 Tax=Mycobacteroides chelonae TaxID=1774 RepID=UPI000917B649|nr:hypothetical protein [Mycobacteroides chelonae]AYM43534.1 hypothetical protein DYE20_20095 [[Mycobacterium] chelonae subsp. gwanakae]OHU14886.1 hypothetical protein BKG75_06705 [Mycobacteroides chelonae]